MFAMQRERRGTGFEIVLGAVPFGQAHGNPHNAEEPLLKVRLHSLEAGQAMG